MPYDADTVWADWVRLLESQGRNVFAAVYDARWRGYQEWVAFVDSRTMADVATELGRTEAEVTAMNTAFALFNTWANAVDNNADDLRKFT